MHIHESVSKPFIGLEINIKQGMHMENVIYCVSFSCISLTQPHKISSQFICTNTCRDMYLITTVFAAI